MGLHLPKRAWAKLNVPPPPTDPAAVEAYGRLFMGRYFHAHDLRLISQSSSPQIDRFEWTDPSGAWYYFGRSREGLSIYRYFESRGFSRAEIEQEAARLSHLLNLPTDRLSTLDLRAT